MPTAPKKRPWPRPHPYGVPYRCVKLVSYWEGFSSCPTDALDGHATIGRGHLIHLGPVTEADRRKWGCITEAQADVLLRQDLRIAAAEVRRLVNVPLNRRQFSALVSFVYNVGAGAFANSTLLRKLNAGDYRSVPSELARWIHGPFGPLPGLVNRREMEGLMFRPLHRPNPTYWRNR